MSVPSRSNKLLVVNIRSPQDSVYVDPRLFEHYMEHRRLANHLFFSIGKRDFARQLVPESKNLREIQLQFLKELREDWVK